MASTSPTATPAATPALAPLPSCLPVVGTIGAAALLEAEEAGSEDWECGTEEPASLLSRPPAVGTIGVALPVIVVVLSPLLVKGAWPKNNKRKEYHRNTSHHFTAGAMRSCSSSIPPDDVSVEMAEVGIPSDVVASSVNELDIDSLMDIV